MRRRLEIVRSYWWPGRGGITTWRRARAGDPQASMAHAFRVPLRLLGLDR